MLGLVHFNVSQIRVAAACPRILYFDLSVSRKQKLKYPRVTRIWKGGDDDVTACGSLFHNAVEKFNREAASLKELAKILAPGNDIAAIELSLRRLIYDHYVDRKELEKANGNQQEAFIGALRRYIRELSEFLAYMVCQGVPASDTLERMFGDNRRRVDVTFHVGMDGEAVHVTGILDYVFYDCRVERHRIIDYKLMPGLQSSSDLFQVGLYALMHNKQHGTEPDAAVLYLHPQRQMEGMQWDEIQAQRYKIYDLLASMVAWAKFDAVAGAGIKPPGNPGYCGRCPYDSVCVDRLGTKSEGQRCTRWAQELAQKHVEPEVERVEPPQVEPEESEDETDGSSVVPPVTPAIDPPDANSVPVQAPSPVPRKADNFPAAELWLGQLADGTRVNMPKSALATHTAIVGAAGSGKTWFAKGVAEEAILQGLPVLAVDPQGDLVQFLHRRDPAGLNDWERQRYERFCQTVEVRVFTPGTSHAVRLSLNPLRLPRMEQLSHIADPARRKEEFDGMLGAVANNLTDLVQAGGEVDAQRAFLLQLLRRFSRDGNVGELTIGQIAAAVRAPEDLGIDDPDALIRKTDREKLARKLKAVIDGPAGQLFRDGLPLDLELMCRPLRPGHTPLNVVYLNALTNDDQKQFFVASLAEEVYRWMVTRASTPGEMNLLFYLDEARDYIPAGARKPPAKEALIRLFTQGRKFGVGSLLCTQSPRSVDYNVFGNCSTKLIGRLESTQDVERVGEWFGTSNGAPPWLPDRKGAGKGSFLGRWPDMSPAWEGKALQSRILFSLHEGAWSPDHLEREMANDPIRAELRKMMS